ncbi:MAG: hydroxyethylthiazole kinase [Beijerinckiaceae bacterium]
MNTISHIVESVRAGRPLVHNVSNHVVMNFTANALLACGASPAMVHAIEEVEEFVAISQSLVINIGTLDAPWVTSMLAAAARAQALGKPWVLDPVGVGATRYRRETCAKLLQHRPSVIRGNASEIIALAGGAASSRGVDSTTAANDAIAAAQALAQACGSVVVISGETDIVTDGGRIAPVRGGAAMMTQITGTGCALSAVTGAMVAVTGDFFAAAQTACATFKVAAESARAAAPHGPGTLAAAFLDALYSVGAGEIAARAAQV